MTQINAGQEGFAQHSIVPTDPLLIGVLRLPLRLLPPALPAEVLSRALNHLLRGQRLAARLSELENRSVCLAIRDAGVALHFRIANGGIVAAGPGPSQVTVRGDIRDFLDLATRAEDADTLFFKRRLCIEGDIETGLHLKNLLDAFEYDGEAHLRAVLPLGVADVAVGLVRRLRRA